MSSEDNNEIVELEDRLNQLEIGFKRLSLELIGTKKELHELRQKRDRKGRKETKCIAKSPKFHDRDGALLAEGDRVILLTRGVDNDKGEEATVHALPKHIGSLYITLIPERYDEAQFKNTINKMSKNVRKIA